MSMSRSLRLVRYHNKQFFLKLRYDLGRELVVLISSAVLLGLFAYIFRDFLTDKLRAIPPADQTSIARVFASILMILMGPFIASRVHQLWRDEPSLKSFALRSGENPREVKAFLTLQTLLLLVLGYFFYWRFVGLPFGAWAWPKAIGWQAASLAAGAVSLVLKREKPMPSFKPLLDDHQASRQSTLVTWRWKQIFLRNRLAKLCLGLALFLQIAIGTLLFLKAPFPLTVLLAMASGLLIACAPSFQLEEDMRAIWFERQVACSHEEFTAVYQTICIRLAIVFGCSVLLFAMVGRGFENPIETLKLVPITILFPLALPAVMFQIAPERPILQIMTIALAGLFLATAIFAHWGAVALLPIALVYAKQYQQNNFYRS